jgi:transposase-like protein
MKVLDSLSKLREKAKLKEDLTNILETPHGKRFFKVLLRECHVTKPVFHSDEAKLRECEGRRRLAMSFLTLLGQDDPQELINKIEMENK